MTIAWSFIDAYMFVGERESSLPPATITRASPVWINRNASPIALAPVAQAVLAVPEGPKRGGKVMMRQYMHQQLTFELELDAEIS